MKHIKKRAFAECWIGGIRGVLVLFFLIGWLGACKVASDPEPEPVDTNNLTVQAVTVSDTVIQDVTSQLRQSVAPLKDGGFAIVWLAGEFPSRDVRIQWVDAQGNRRLEQGGKSIIFNYGDADSAIVIARPGGGVYVAFSHFDGLVTQVKVQAFDETMTPLWPEPAAASDYGSGELQLEPCLALVPSGGVYVSYSCYNSIEKYQVKCQRLDTDGNRMWGETGISLCANYVFVTYSRAIPDNSGGLFVFWKNLRDGFAPEPLRDPVLVEGQHLTSSGNKTWGNEPKIIHTTNSLATIGYTYTELMAVPDGLGGAIVSWTEDMDHSDGQLDVLAQKVNTAGTLLWNNGVILSDPTQFSALDGIIEANDGGVFISFGEYISESAIRLWMQRLGANGEKLWGTYGIELSNPNGQRNNYGVYGYFTGKYLNLCWTYQPVPYNFDFDVMMARLKADGTLMDPPGGVALDNTEDKQFSRGMVYNEVSGEYFVLWEDSRRSRTWDDFDIYGAILKKSTSSISTQLSSPATPLSPAKKPYSPGSFRMDNNYLDPHRPFGLPGQKVVHLGGD